MKITSVCLTLLLGFSLPCEAQTLLNQLVSPNGKIELNLGMQKNQGDPGPINCSVGFRKSDGTLTVLQTLSLGLVRGDQRFADLELIEASKIKLIHDKYEMPHGKRKYCENQANEMILRFRNSEGYFMNILFRVYNDGIAFRYSFPVSSDSILTVTDELTSFHIPAGSKSWMQPFQESYEDFYIESNTGENPKQQEWGLPALISPSDDVYMLISEADISRQNCATHLSNSTKPDIFKIDFPKPKKDQDQSGQVFNGSWQSAWRVIIIGSLADIVESTLITDLSTPSLINETDWIQPGVASWVYWSENHGSKDFMKVIEFIDLAVEMNWPYVLIDWEWDVMTNGGNLEDAVKYANSKGIKPLMWYNSGTAWLDPTPVDRLVTPEMRAKEFEWLNKIGVYGIKVDFFNGDSQGMMAYYIDILEDAAKFHLLVNFHGATLPRGWARTYPNLMTTEAVYGAEWYNNVPTFTAAAARHNATLPFTRNVVGSMDYTPVEFSDSQHPHITSYAHELALSVLFESAIQHFGDRPQSYLQLPEAPKTFLQSVPTAWDDIRFIGGAPGETVLIARRKEEKWYIAGINGTTQPREITLDLSFLNKGKHRLQLIKDGQNSNTFDTKILTSKRGEKIVVRCLPQGGFVGIIE